jgi:hypothetical protein
MLPALPPSGRVSERRNDLRSRYRTLWPDQRVASAKTEKGSIRSPNQCKPGLEMEKAFPVSNEQRLS